jgi:hypothetical protein
LSAHNAGPWTRGDGNHEVIYAGKGTGRFEIASVAGPTSVVPHRETHANALLIAAAPDLLAACELLLAEHECKADCDATNRPCPQRIGRAAVAKAGK